MSSELKKTHINLKKECSQLLKAMAANNVDPSDKEAAVFHVKISLPTINEYLKGNVTKIDKAIELIEFLNKRIEEKSKRLHKKAKAA